MALDKRGQRILMFIGDGPEVPKTVVEEGDEATLYHEGNIVMASVKSISEHQIMGFITRSAYDPDMHQEFITGKELIFNEENIFGVSKKKLQA